MTTQILQHNEITWTNIINPSEEDMKQLQARYAVFHPLLLEDVLSEIERPKLEEYDDYMFVVLHFPLWNSTKRVSYPSEVDIFIGKDYIVTIHDGTLRALNKLFEDCSQNALTRERYLSEVSRIFYIIIDRLVDDIFPMLHKIDEKVRHIEEIIFEETERTVIQELAYVRRDIISLRRILSPQVEIIARFVNKDLPSFIHLGDYFSDILDHISKAKDMVDDYSEVVAGLVETTSILATLRTNEVIQFLTIISVVILPLGVVVGFYGMNVPLAFQDNTYVAWAILAFMVGISGALLVYFRRRRWI
jgi:magnesium transporter